MGVEGVVKRLEERARRDHGIGRQDSPSPPLYAYRCTDELFAALRGDLARTLRERDRLTSIDCAGFCLYAAEQFCREHDGGPWKWETVLASLSYSPTPQRLYEIVGAGMRYWRRAIFDGGSRREYLFTLGCEGGLPLRVLRQEGTALRRFVSRVLRDREMFTYSATREIAEQHKDCLPALLRNESVYEICTKIVESVVELRRICGGASDPIAHLDHTRPGWQTTVPLRLDLEVAQELLTGLLKQRRESTRIGVPAISLELVVHTQPLSLVRRVRCHPEIPAGSLASILNVDEATLPSQVHLYVQDDDGARLPIAIASAYGDAYRLSLAHGETTIDPHCDVTVVAAVRARTIAQAPVSGSEASPTDLPLFFATQEGDVVHRFLSAGALQTRREQVLCLLPTTTQFVVDHGVMEALGPIAGYEGNAFHLRGAARITCGDETFLATTRAETETTRRFSLSGSKRRLGLGSSEVFVGRPTVVEVHGGVSRTPVPDRCVQWRSATGSSRSWQAMSSIGPGDVEIRVVEEGGTVYRTSATVFPASFQCEVRPDRDALSGTIWLDGLPGAEVGIAPSLITEWKKVANDKRIGIWMSATTSPPPTVPVRVRFAGGGDAGITVPFPGMVRLFLDRSGQTLPKGTFLPLHRVLGARAIVRTPDAGRKFYLSGRLFHGNTPQGPETTLEYLEQIDDNSLGLPLDLVQGLVAHLLSSTDDLDGRVRIRLHELGGTGRDDFYIDIGRYDAWLDRAGSLDNGGYEVRIADECAAVFDEDTVRRISLRACRVADPLETEKPLSRSGLHTWDFRFAEHPPGAWLITGWIGDRSVVRPLLITVRGDQFQHSTTELAAAVERHAVLRHAEIARILRECAADISCSHWQEVFKYLETLRHLPPSTFDVVRELVRHPGAVVRALYRRPDLAPLLWNHLEQLPFLYKLVPLREWMVASHELVAFKEAQVAALRAVDESLAADFDAHVRAGESVRTVLLHAAERSRFAVDLHWLLYSRQSDGFRKGLDVPQRPISRDREHRDHGKHSSPLMLQLHGARERLLRDHAEETWPTWSWEPVAAGLDVPGFAASDTAEHTRGVLYAPLVAAGFAVAGRKATPDLVFNLKRMAEFDVDWFETAYGVCLHMLADKCALDPEFLR